MVIAASNYNNIIIMLLSTQTIVLKFGKTKKACKRIIYSISQIIEEHFRIIEDMFGVNVNQTGKNP